MKLNLGAGTKRIEGYVGVDAMPGADVQADILALPQEWEGMAEEVMVIHALEHLAYYESQKALLEWRRVLQPGGKLVIESPNLESACMSFLSNPENLAYGLWPLYGDQSRGDIYTVHKSGWTPQMLIRELEMAGYVNCQQEPAQFKKREPRDFRVVGYKA